MRNRTTKTLLSLTAIMAFALPGVAQARHGADDPAGHVRHSSHSSHVRHHGTHHKRHAHHHATTTARHGGADDGPNHR